MSISQVLSSSCAALPKLGPEGSGEDGLACRLRTMELQLLTPPGNEEEEDEEEDKEKEEPDKEDEEEEDIEKRGLPFTGKTFEALLQHSPLLFTA